MSHCQGQCPAIRKTDSGNYNCLEKEGHSGPHRGGPSGAWQMPVTEKTELDELRVYAEELATLLVEAGSILDYWQGNNSSVTGDKVRERLLPAIRAAVAKRQGCHEIGHLQSTTERSASAQPDREASSTSTPGVATRDQGSADFQRTPHGSEGNASPLHPYPPLRDAFASLRTVAQSENAVCLPYEPTDGMLEALGMFHGDGKIGESGKRFLEEDAREVWRRLRSLATHPWHSQCHSPNEAQDALRWRWWLANGMAVARDEDGDWTCWLAVPSVPFRSQTTDPNELTDALLARFPLDGGRSHAQCVPQEPKA